MSVEAGRRPLIDRLASAPTVFDGRLAEETRAAVAPPSAARALVEGAAGGAPFLARTMRAEAAWLASVWDRAPEEAVAALVEESRQAAALEVAEQMRALRIARRRAALLIALADLGGVWDVATTTRALSDMADAAIAAVLDGLLSALGQTGRIPGFDPERPALAVLALGKLGAQELNYSSDVDLIIVFDDEALVERGGPAAALEARERFPRLVRDFVRRLSQPTPDGFVARVDLRLRPDPGATPAAMAMTGAERYYEAMGRTWERAAHIKARPCAGDVAAARAYLDRLKPFVWRRALDFAAVEDAAEMLALIRRHKGGAEVAVADQDVKLGAGGIREIEFLAQTEQLILGGRDPSLRAPRTLEALRALSDAGRLAPEALATLKRAYDHLRRLEHRLQMIEDRQTHRVPADPSGLARIAALMGAPSVDAFVAETEARMAGVRRIAGARLDRPRDAGQPVERCLPTALEHWAEPERAEALVRGWFAGRLRAVRSPRARRRLERMTPDILARMSRAPDPMLALVSFDRFLYGLPAGVQLLALFEANPSLLDLLTEICAASPQLAQYLSRRPEVLDAVLDADFFAPPPAPAALARELEDRLTAAADYQAALGAARRWAAERRFQLGVGLLRAIVTPQQAAAGFSDLADICLGALWPRAIAELAERHGPPPGRGAAVLAMGKLGSREMTATSDLDLIIVYDADLAETSEGPKPIAAAQYYARLTQRLTAALSAPTPEGVLYEVDMRLRPSGRSGPLATSLSAFERYQRESAWVWEHMALTRARAVVGAPDVVAAVGDAVARALAQPRDRSAVIDAAREMRAKLAAAHAAEQGRLWALKHGSGGLMEIECLTQAALLTAQTPPIGCDQGGVAPPAALAALAEAGLLDPTAAAALAEAYRLQAALQQVARIALDCPFDPERGGDGVRAALTRTVGASDFEALEADLRGRRAAAAACAEAWFAAETP